VTVDFHDDTDDSDHAFAGAVAEVSFGAANYRWHPFHLRRQAGIPGRVPR